MTAATAPLPPAADQETAVAARLCWHAVQICRVLDHSVAELQVVLTEAAEHTDAVIELALALVAIEPTPAGGDIAGNAPRPDTTSVCQQGAGA